MLCLSLDLDLVTLSASTRIISDSNETLENDETDLLVDDDSSLENLIIV